VSETPVDEEAEAARRKKNTERFLKWRAEHLEEHNEYLRKRYRENPEVRAAQRERGLKKKYGLSLADWDEMFESQSGKCLICETDNPPRWATDHCHRTNAVRGILCSRCNTLLGMVDDDIGYLQSAIRYLERYQSAPTIH
jgi:hypothetical protein